VEPDAHNANESGAISPGGYGDDPAVLISLSKDAMQSLLQRSEDDISQLFAERTSSTASYDMEARRKDDDKRIANMQAMMEVQKQMHDLKSTIIKHEGFSRFADTWQAQYDQLLDTKPVPATELTGKDKEAAFELLKSKGLPLPAAGGSVQFSPDGQMLLIFKGDGSVWTRDGNVPETEAQKQFLLSNLNDRIGRGRDDISGVESQYDMLQEQLETLQKQHDSLWPRSAPQPSY